ncbi:MAG: FAD-dependent oxidoreductase [Deltaproteobacteria bacterium]
MQTLKESGVEAAARVLARTQPLPSVCGRVCPAPCMSSCNRESLDGSLNIRGLERWVGDHMTGQMPEVESCLSSHRVAVVGGGPAGLGAAYILAPAGHDVTVYDSESELGGVLRTAIPSYRLPRDVLDRDINRILGLGVKVKCGEVLDAARVQSLSSEYDAVVLATGQACSRASDCSGVELPGVVQGLEFLYGVKTGAAVTMRGSVVVIGGGNTAVDCARTALRCGARDVSIVYRRGREEMPAIEQEIEEAIAEGINLVLYRQPVRFIGEGRLTGVEVAEVVLGEPDASGRKRPVPTDRLTILSCDHVLLAIGQDADLGILPSEWAVKGGRVYQSDRPMNVWLAGDLTTGAGTVAHAVGHGKNVARSILDEFEGRRSSEFDIDTPEPEIIAPEHIRFEHFPRAERQDESHLPVTSRASGFEEVNLGLTDASEAERCFSCGRCTQCDTCLVYCPEGIVTRIIDGYAISEDYCKGCGICAWECPRHAMRMTAQGSGSSSRWTLRC